MKTNRNKHKVKPPSPAEMGLDNGSAGKGSIPRNCFSDDFKKNFDAIKGRGCEGFVKRGKALVKVYGK
jgi:hypothetical protein